MERKINGHIIYIYYLYIYSQISNTPLEQVIRTGHSKRPFELVIRSDHSNRSFDQTNRKDHSNHRAAAPRHRAWSAKAVHDKCHDERHDKRHDERPLIIFHNLNIILYIVFVISK